MPALPGRKGHPAALEYRRLVFEQRPLNAGLPELQLEAAFDGETGLLMVCVRRLPCWAFETAWLVDGPGLGRPLFTNAGEALWGKLRDYGYLALRNTGRPEFKLLLSVATFLAPAAIEHARVLRQARAA